MSPNPKNRMVHSPDVRTREGHAIEIKSPRQKIGDLVIDGKTHAASFVPSAPMPPKK
jgi:hypothetical protein